MTHWALVYMPEAKLLARTAARAQAAAEAKGAASSTATAHLARLDADATHVLNQRPVAA